jgi:hypothetical protein
MTSKAKGKRQKEKVQAHPPPFSLFTFYFLRFTFLAGHGRVRTPGGQQSKIPETKAASSRIESLTIALGCVAMDI